MASTIERRVLLNYRIDPEVAQRQLPAPFRPQLVDGAAVGGICLIRLVALRPAGLPAAMGLRTENAAHRMSVEWTDAGSVRRGVYVPRRDTNSWVTAALGGRVFEGTHERSRFDVHDDGEQVAIRVRGRDGLRIEVIARSCEEMQGSLFESTASACTFFRSASVGYSPNARRGAMEGMRLDCERWEASSLHVERVTSSVFDDPGRFPVGSIRFDSAIVMRSLPARWSSEGPAPLAHLADVGVR